jgi:16S rRNA (guanine966-N2)-methyltransferase
MRILGGQYKGRFLSVPKNLPIRPTTGFAFEGLFNILNNRLNFENLEALDLFAGTGHIAFELASRGAKSIKTVDKNGSCLRFIKQTAEELQMPIYTVKEDVFSFLKQQHTAFDFIFADPPYALNNIPEIHQHIVSNKLLKSDGLCIIEHGAKTDLSTLAGFERQRSYGNVQFSFFTRI